MRTIGQIPHAWLRITAFQSNNKYILKIEAGPFEQHYKFLESDRLRSFDDLAALVTDDFLAQVKNNFDEMNRAYRGMFSPEKPV
ncbi:MAG: hypothetical protein IT266_08965 [Saprospiraceae bacterium]|nr:hypothetical protein [Saprospiraceae bacterium]